MYILPIFLIACNYAAGDLLVNIAIYQLYPRIFKFCLLSRCFALVQMAEYRISIYGRKMSEWDQLASWIVNNDLYSENVVWLIQVK